MRWILLLAEELTLLFVVALVLPIDALIHLLLGGDLHLLLEAVHPPPHLGAIGLRPGLLHEGCVVVLFEGVRLFLLGDDLLTELEVHHLDVLLFADGAVLLFEGLFVHVQGHCLQGEGVDQLLGVEGHHPILHLQVHAGLLGGYQEVVVPEDL